MSRRRLGLLCVVLGLGLLAAPRGGARAGVDGAGAERAGAERAGADKDRAAGDVVTLHVAGDISYPNGWNGEAECEQSGAALFAQVRPLLERGELNFANLEMPLTERKATARKVSVIVARPHRLAWVREAGFNVFSIANNHILDPGTDGLLDTLRHLRAADRPERPLYFAGAGETREAARALRSFCAPRHTTRFGLLALSNISSPRVDADSGRSTLERIRAAAATVDALIVSVHHGIEYQIAPTASAIRRYRRYIDAGARVVAVHHSHVISAVERYHGGVIFYGLGNLSFNSKTLRIRHSTAPHFGMLGRVVLRDGQIDSVRVFPLYVGNRDPLRVDKERLAPRHATPQLLRGRLATRALSEIVRASTVPPLRAAATGYELRDDTLFLHEPAAPGAPGERLRAAN
jgi:poly-gamma-glutamate capsule biosynthesis protein CapA/YwtB (metallophosphatase superfamily)